MREPIPMWCFVVVVVRRGADYLLVQEKKHGQTWYLPAGRVEFGEDFRQAALRETLEETGVPVRLTGLLRLEHSVRSQAGRLRVVFLAEPIDATPPKSRPDEESLRAEWVSRTRLAAYPLRGDDVRQAIDYVDSGGPVFPLSLLAQEGDAFR